MSDAASSTLAADLTDSPRARRLRILSLNFGHAYAHLFLLIYPTVVLTLEVEQGGSYGDLLLPATFGFVAFAAGALPAGWLGDRWSRRGMVALMFFGLAVGAVVTGLATTTWQIAIGLGLIGLFAAIYHPVGIAMLVEEARPLGRALGVNGVFGNLGVAAAPLLAATLSEGFGWRWAFFVPAALSLATGFLFLALPPRPGPAPEVPKPQTKGAPRGAFSRVVFFLIASGVLGGLVFDGATVSLPKLIEDQLGNGLSGVIGAGGLASAIFAVAAFAQILVGRLIDRYPIRPLAFAILLLQAPFLFLAGALAGWSAFPAALGAMWLIFGQIPISDALVARYSAPAWRARFYALKYLLSSGVAAVTVPLIALLYDPTSGLYTLYVLLALLALGKAGAALMLPRGK